MARSTRSSRDSPGAVGRYVTHVLDMGRYQLLLLSFVGFALLSLGQRTLASADLAVSRLVVAVGGATVFLAGVVAMGGALVGVTHALVTRTNLLR